MIHLSDYAGYLLILYAIIQNLIIVYKWEWYMRFPRGRNFAERLGEETTRIVLFVIGLLVFGYGIITLIYQN